MDNKYENIIDDFKSVCSDNIKALKLGQTVFIYKDDVFFKTLELCNKENINVYYKKIDDYYVVKKQQGNKKERFYR